MEVDLLENFPAVLAIIYYNSRKFHCKIFFCFAQSDYMIFLTRLL